MVFDTILGKGSLEKYKDYYDSNLQVFSFVEKDSKANTDMNYFEENKIIQDNINIYTEPNQSSSLGINDKILCEDFKINFMSCLKKIIVKKK